MRRFNSTSIEYIYIGKIAVNVFVNKGNIFLCNIFLSYVLLYNCTYIPSSYVSAGNDSGVWCYYPRRSKLGVPIPKCDY